MWRDGHVRGRRRLRLATGGVHELGQKKLVLVRVLCGRGGLGGDGWLAGHGGLEERGDGGLLLGSNGGGVGIGEDGWLRGHARHLRGGCVGALRKDG